VSTVEWRLVMMSKSLLSRFSVPLLTFLLTFAPMLVAARAAEDPRKITVVSFGLFGDQGVFRSEATGAAEIVSSRFGGGPVVVRFNTKTGGGATVEGLAATLHPSHPQMAGGENVGPLLVSRH
jgi:hypothetical protein